MIVHYDQADLFYAVMDKSLVIARTTADISMLNLSDHLQCYSKYIIQLTCTKVIKQTV